MRDGSCFDGSERRGNGKTRYLFGLVNAEWRATRWIVLEQMVWVVKGQCSSI